MCDKQYMRGKKKNNLVFILILFLIPLSVSALEFNLSVYETGENYIIWNFDPNSSVTNISIDGIYQSVIPVSGLIYYNNLESESSHIIRVSNGSYIESLISSTSSNILQFLYSRIWLIVGFICLILSPFISIFLAYFAAIIYFVSFSLFLINNQWETSLLCLFLGGISFTVGKIGGEKI